MERDSDNVVTNNILATMGRFTMEPVPRMQMFGWLDDRVSNSATEGTNVGGW